MTTGAPLLAGGPERRAVRANALEALTARAYGTADAGLVPTLRFGAALTATDVLEGDGGRCAAVRGGAWLVAYKLAHRPADLAAAIAELEAAHRAAPTAGRAANLASARLERAGTDGSGQDLTAALELLEEAIADPAASPTTRRRRQLIRLGALVDAVERGLATAAADAAEAVDLGRALIAEVEEAAGEDPDDAAVLGQASGLTGSALLLASYRADLAPDELAEMVGRMEVALQVMADGHPDRAGRWSNLASALSRRFELEGRREDIREAAHAARRAVDLLPVGHPQRPVAVNNLLNTVVPAYEVSGLVEGLADAVEEALALPVAFPPGHPARAVAESNSGLVVRVAAHALDRPELIDLAVELQRSALARAGPAGAWESSCRASLALALSDLYLRDGDLDVLDEAIAEAEAAGVQGAGVDRAGTATNLGNLYHQRFLARGDLRDLDLATAHHADGIAAVPDGHPDRSTLLNNAGIAFHDRYLRIGDPDDVVAAIQLLDEGVRVTPPGDPAGSARRVNLASALHSASRHDGFDDGELSAADAGHLRAALADGLVGRERAVATGVLVEVLRSRWTATGDGAARDELLALESLDQDAPDPTGALRRGITARAVGRPADERRHLLAALRQGRRRRPGVAIGAARALVDGLLQDVAAGDAGAEPALALLEEVGETALEQRDRIVGLDQPRPAELSWFRDADGVGDAWAHGLLLTGRTADAAAVLRRSHATFLGRTVPRPSGPPGPWVRASLWSTSAGTGLIVTDGTGHRTGQRIAVPEAELAAVADRLRRAAVAGPEAIAAVADEAAAVVTAALGRSLARLVPAGVEVVLDATGPLACLPLAAATVEQQPFGQRNLLSHTLSEDMASWARRAAGGPVAMEEHAVTSFSAPSGSALPPLPFAAAESRYVADGGTRHQGPDASADRFLDALRTPGVVHAALHGRAAAVDPLASCLLFAGDEPLAVERLLDAGPFAARLVLLSACETALSGRVASEQSLTVASALHAAGVPGVIASLWSVGDRSSAELVAAVVDRLRGGAAPAAALRDVQADLIGSGAPVAEWAAFQVLGA